MNFKVWDKESHQNSTAEEHIEWYKILADSWNTTTIEAFTKQLHESTRTPFYIAYFGLYNDEDTLISICNVIEKDRMYYLHDIGIHPQHQNKLLESILIQKVLEYLKEQDVTTVRVTVPNADSARIALYQSIGFERYDETPEYHRFQYHIIEKPRYLPPFHHLWLLKLYWGIPYHKDNNDRFYLHAFSEQISAFIFIVTLGNIGLYIVTQSVLWFLGFNILLFIISNTMNVIRYIIEEDIRYRKQIRKFLLCTLFTICGFLLVEILITIIRDTI